MKCSRKTVSESRNSKLLRSYIKLCILHIVTVVWPIPVAVWSKPMSVAARMIGLLVRIPLRLWMSISYNYFVPYR